jgi:hypothetical protein
MTTDKQLQFQVRLSNNETEATTWSFARTERVTNQLEREIYRITANAPQQLKTEFSISLIECEAWWETICIQVLWKAIEQHVIHFGYPKMHLFSHLSQSIRRMGSGANFSPEISEWLYIANVKEAY